MQCTIDGLREDLEKQIRSFVNYDNVRVVRFYIGKSETENFEERQSTHRSEGYTDTLEIAHGNPTLITQAEEILISYFQGSDLKGLLANIDSNANGNNDADKLYVSYEAYLKESDTPISIDELEDDELNWPESYELISSEEIVQKVINKFRM